VPYAITPKFLRWAQPLADELGLSAFAEDQQWMEIYGDKV
jgi:hypothetical protein